MTHEWTNIADEVPIDAIEVLNPRSRNEKVFREIVDSIAKVGLKRPITVARKRKALNGPQYSLVCGQGRLEAFRLLGQEKIPAVVIDASDVDCMVMSLVENIARRKHSPMELMHGIRRLREGGYKPVDIATKTGLSADYVRGILHLAEKGEERLLKGVEGGDVPLSVAIDIAEANSADVQRALTDAYDQGVLKGKKLLKAKRLVERRFELGKAMVPSHKKRMTRKLTSEDLVRTYEEEAKKQRLFLKRAEMTRGRLVFVVEALHQLLRDENFVNLLRVQRLDTVPQNLIDLMRKGEAA